MMTVMRQPNALTTEEVLELNAALAYDAPIPGFQERRISIKAALSLTEKYPHGESSPGGLLSWATGAG